MNSKIYLSKYWRNSIIIFWLVILLIWIAVFIIATTDDFEYNGFMRALEYLENIAYGIIPASLLSSMFFYIIYKTRLLWSHVTIDDDSFRSIIFYRTACRVDRRQPIYYSLSKCRVNIDYDADYVIISNVPFKLYDRKWPFFTVMNVYDPRKQIALPYTSDLFSLMPINSTMIERFDCTPQAVWSRKKGGHRYG